MTREQIFMIIDNTDKYSEVFKNKLKETYDFFSSKGYNFRVHALGRVISPKLGKNKRGFPFEDVLEVLNSSINYIDGEDKYVRYFNGFSAIQAKDTGEIISFVDNNFKPKKGWRKYNAE